MTTAAPDTAPSSGLPLHGRTVVVTGASRGIGAAVVRRVAILGARVVLVARGADQLQAMADEIGGGIVVPCDLADAVAVTRAAATIARHLNGAPDVIVNNAGAFAVTPAHEQDPDHFEVMLAVNLSAPFRFLRAFLPTIRARGSGHVVTIGSIADRAIFPGNAAYAASKFGLRALHEVLRAELRGTGVRTTLVSPGPTDTTLWDPLDPDGTPGFTPRADMLPAAAVADAVGYALVTPASVNIDELRLSRA